MKVYEILSRIGKLKNINISEIIESDNFNYRNKVTYPIRKTKYDEIQMGYFERNSHDLVDLDHCPIQYSILDGIYLRIKKDIISNNYRIYNEKAHNEGIRHLG